MYYLKSIIIHFFNREGIPVLTCRTRTLSAILFIAFLSGFIKANGQNLVPIKGVLFTETGKPLDYATVTLVRIKDSVFVKSTRSTATGDYSFSDVNPGQYIVRITAVGFVSKISPSFEYKGYPVTLTPIKLLNATSVLKEVSITSTVPLIDRQSDRLVVNVAGSTLAAGNNALEILERAPGVSIDKDGNVSLNGKSGVTVMIDDRLTYLSADQLSTLLRSTDGGTIQAIEIITNPSAKYDAAGNSGIINIKLKKNQREGTNGNAILGVAQGHDFRDNATLTINHKSGRLNIFANVSHTDTKYYIKEASDRTIDSAEHQSYYSQRSTSVEPVHNSSFRIGSDYQTGKDNVAGITLGGYLNNNGVKNDGNAVLNDLSQLSSQNTFSQASQTHKNIGVNLNDKLLLDTSGQSLSANVDLIRYNNNGNALFSTFFYFPDGTAQHSPYYLRQQTPANINVHTAKVDYVYPAGNGLKLESGIKLSDVKTDNDLQAQTSSDNKNYLYNTQLSNEFIYTEKIDAGYFNATKVFNTTTLQAGLRTEYTASTGVLSNNSSGTVNRHYLNFFPNLFIDHKLDEDNKISFNYSRRIDRPNYQSLNPFVFYLDPYTREQGNPFLRPQYTNNFELDYTHHQFNVGLNYSHTADVNTETVLTDTLTKISSETIINLKSLDQFSANVSTSFDIFSWWSGNVNGYLIYNSYKSGDIENASYNTNGFSYSAKTLQTFKVGKNYKIELNARYQSPSIYGLYHVRSVSSVDGGVSRSLLGKRANIKLSVSDIFNGNKTDLTENLYGSQFHGYQKYDTRIGRLSFTYNFGSTKIKTIEHQSGADDEKERAANGH